MSSLAELLDGMTPGEREIFLDTYFDFFGYADAAPLMIADKETRELTVFRPNYAQRHIWRLKRELAEAGELVRLIIPKARQLGMTTAHAAELFHTAAVHERRECYVLMQDLAPARAFYFKLKTMLDNMDPILRPKLEQWDTGRTMMFDTNSRIMVESVKKRGVGRGETLDHVHATELPSWDDAEAVLTGIEQSVPDIPGGRTTIVLESTCEGVGDYWHHIVVKADRGKGQYKLGFLPWWIEPVYERNPLPRELREEPFTASEEAIAKRILAEGPSYGVHDLTPDVVIRKMIWRRRKLENMASEDKFMQEYPMDVTEAFRGTGRPVFPAASVRFHRNRIDADGMTTIRNPANRYDIVTVGKDMSGSRERRVLQREKRVDGRLKVWEPPVAGARYVLPADVASGEAADYSVIHVLKLLDNNVGWEQAAVWHGHCNAKDLAYFLVYLWNWYNPKLSIMVPERNGPGLNVVETIVDDIRPSGMRLYQYEHRDLATNETVNRYGFATTTTTRPAIIEEFHSALDSDRIIIRDIATLNEIEQFAYNKKGKAEAPSRGHDDLLMALMIGNYARHTFRQGRVNVSQGRGIGWDHLSGGGGRRSSRAGLLLPSGVRV